MGGFLPLLEAFIAFALTMAALTTVVSALVGTWHKLTRARAYGLRMQMVYFFRNELKPLVGRIAGEPGASSALVALAARLAAGRTGRGGDEVADLAQFLVDTTLLPQVVDFEPPKPAATDTPAATGAPVATDARVAMLRNGIRQPLWFVTGRDGFTRKPLDIAQRFYRWRSLRFALDSLPVAEFEVRFRASEIGKMLREALGDEKRMDAVVAIVSQRFQALGNAASESFQRGAHIASYAAGFVLAFGANVDSFHLLSNYLARPELTRQLIAEYERSGAVPGVKADQGAATALLPKSAQLDALRARLKEAVEDKRLGALDKQLQGELQTRLAEVDTALSEVRASAIDATAMIIGVGQAFPVGWSLYPNCAGLGGDPRCLKLLGDRPDSIWQTHKRDPGGFYRWLVGVLATGLLLGLGTPFWVQVINGALYARNLLRGPNSSGTGAPVKKDEEPGKQPPVPPTAAPAVASGPGLRILPS